MTLEQFLRDCDRVFFRLEITNCLPNRKEAQADILLATISADLLEQTFSMLVVGNQLISLEGNSHDP